MLRKFFEARWAVAAALASVFAVDLGAALIFPRNVSNLELVAACAFAAVGFAGAFFLLRRPLLSIAVAAAPFAGLLPAAFIVRVQTPSLGFAYLAGFALALFLADEIAQRTGSGANVAEAVVATLGRNSIAVISAAVFAALLAGLLIPLGGELHGPMAAALCELGAGWGGLVALPLAAALMPAGEEAIARTNRLNEARERRFEKLIPLAEPRWGWSLSGIAVVFAVLAVFGARPLQVASIFLHSPMQIPVVAAGILLVFAAGLVAAQDWWRMIGAAGAIALAGAIGAWGYARLGITLTGVSWLALFQTLGAGAILVLLLAGAARAEPGEDTRAASARVFLGKAGVAIVATMTSIVTVLLLALVMHREAIALAAVLLFAGLGAVLFQPAITIAVERLIPRRATIEARYKVS